MKTRIFLCCLCFGVLLGLVSCAGSTNRSLSENIRVVLYADTAETWVLDIQKDGTVVAAHGDRSSYPDGMEYSTYLDRLQYLTYFNVLTMQREEGELRADQFDTVDDAIKTLETLDKTVITQIRNNVWMAAVFVGDKTYNFIYDQAEKPEYCAVVEQIISCSPMEIVLDDFE